MCGWFCLLSDFFNNRMDIGLGMDIIVFMNGLKLNFSVEVIKVDF